MLPKQSQTFMMSLSMTTITCMQQQQQQMSAHKEFTAADYMQPCKHTLHLTRSVYHSLRSDTQVTAVTKPCMIMHDERAPSTAKLTVTAVQAMVQPMPPT